MSPVALASRLTVFALFAALSAGTVQLLFPGTLPLAPSGAELEALENGVQTEARLHPPAPPPVIPGAAAFCSGCHPAPPHPGISVKAALVNEHASRMDCLLCHWSAANGPRPAAGWRVAASAVAFLGVLPHEASSPAALERLRAAVTVGRRCFERGPACAGCHRPGGMSSLVRSNSSAARVASLERLENYFTLAPGEKWYLPQMQ